MSNAFYLTNHIFNHCELQEKTSDKETFKTSGYFTMDVKQCIPQNTIEEILEEARELTGLNDPKIAGIDLNYEYDALSSTKDLEMTMLVSLVDEADSYSEPDNTLLEPIEVVVSDEVKAVVLQELGISEAEKFQELIEEAQKIRNRPEAMRPWIYKTNKDGAGEIDRRKTIVADIMPILEELKAQKISLSAEQIKEFKKDSEVECEYTYNNQGKIDTDFVVWYKPGCPVGLFCLHNGHDAREGFTDYAAFAMDGADNALDGLVDLESYNQYIDFTDPYTGNKYSAGPDPFSDSYLVYDEDGNDLGSYTSVGVDELISEMNERFNEMDCDR